MFIDRLVGLDVVVKICVLKLSFVNFFHDQFSLWKTISENFGLLPSSIPWISEYLLH